MGPWGVWRRFGVHYPLLWHRNDWWKILVEVACKIRPIQRSAVLHCSNPKLNSPAYGDPQVFFCNGRVTASQPYYSGKRVAVLLPVSAAKIAEQCL
jgi:hypothetical protein